MLSTQIFKLYIDSLIINPVKWTIVSPTKDDLDWIHKECNDISSFDPKGFRSEMLKAWKSGKASLVCYISQGYRILVISFENLKPTPLWSITLQSFCKEQRVLWLAHPETRNFPTDGSEPGPLAVNGGYTLSCSNNSIVIYRKEEALRVLIHELLHATCTDNHSDELPLMEAKTEAWAEVIYCCVLAKGNLIKALRLWDLQVSWILKQTDKLINEYGVVGPSNYAWRYTVGKAAYLNKWGLLERSTKRNKDEEQITTSLTNPALFLQ
jgi:hypothetical protein